MSKEISKKMPADQQIDQSHYETSYGDWDKLDAEPSDAYADRSQAYFEMSPSQSGDDDLGEDYPRGV